MTDDFPKRKEVHESLGDIESPIFKLAPDLKTRLLVIFSGNLLGDDFPRLQKFDGVEYKVLGTESPREEFEKFESAFMALPEIFKNAWITKQRHTIQKAKLKRIEDLEGGELRISDLMSYAADSDPVKSELPDIIIGLANELSGSMRFDARRGETTNLEAIRQLISGLGYSPNLEADCSSYRTDKYKYSEENTKALAEFFLGVLDYCIECANVEGEFSSETSQELSYLLETIPFTYK